MTGTTFLEMSVGETYTAEDTYRWLKENVPEFEEREKELLKFYDKTMKVRDKAIKLKKKAKVQYADLVSIPEDYKFFRVRDEFGEMLKKYHSMHQDFLHDYFVPADYFPKDLLADAPSDDMGNPILNWSKEWRLEERGTAETE